MNYLAHIYLSGDDPEIRVGGLLGDFVKGPLNRGSLKNHYPQRIEQGIALHRAIDSWFDQQSHIISARARFQPPFRRFAGIIIDICYDHLLARRWQHFHHQSLERYASEFYGQLQQHYCQLPDNAKRFADNAPRVKLLESYTQTDAIATALERISHRFQRPTPLTQAMPEVERELPLLMDEFEQLFPQLQRFAATKLHSLTNLNDR